MERGRSGASTGVYTRGRALSRSIALATRVTRHRISAGRLETTIAAQGGRPSSTCHNSIESLLLLLPFPFCPLELLNASSIDKEAGAGEEDGEEDGEEGEGKAAEDGDVVGGLSRGIGDGSIFLSPAKEREHGRESCAGTAENVISVDEDANLRGNGGRGLAAAATATVRRR